MPDPEVHARIILSLDTAAPWWHRQARGAVLVGSDLSALIISGSIAYFAWAFPVYHQPASMYLELAPLLVVFIAGYAVAGLYPGFGLGPIETIRRLSYVTALGFALLATFSFVLKLPHLYSRMTFAIGLGLALVFVALGRFVVLVLVGRSDWWHEPVILIGSGPKICHAFRSLTDASHVGYRPVGVLATRSDIARGALEDCPVLGSLDLASQLSRAGIRVALVEADALHDGIVLDHLQQSFQHVVLLRDSDDLPVEGVQIRNLGGVLGVEYTNNLLLFHNRLLKRNVDLVFSSAALVCALPVIGLSAIAVKILNRGPAFFTQERIGSGGRPFRMFKVRTMRVDAERRLRDHIEKDPDLKFEWETYYKLRNDPRLIPIVGPFLRRFSLDELPQLWCVIKGDMSLVGPRPLPDYHSAKFSPGPLALRQRVRPGITGLWQVTVRGDSSIEEQQKYDSHYIRNWSVWLDVYIFAKTIAAVLSRRGAY